MLLLSPLSIARAQQPLPRIAVCIYNMADTFMSGFSNGLERMAQGLATLTVMDSQNNQNTQNAQVDELLAEGIDALIVNPVDRTAAVYLIRMAMQKQTPIVFINREPLLEDLRLFNKAYYVGIDPKQQGSLSGEKAAWYFQNVPGADRNGDGVMQLVLFKGEPGHQDTELRTQYALLALKQCNVQVELLSEDVALWDRTLGQEHMAALLNQYGDQIECVISNNDDMALGAIDALKAADYFSGRKFMPVFGNDATGLAMEALEQGSLYATVYNNAEAQGAAALRLAVLLSKGEEVTEENFSYSMQDRVVYINSVIFTADDMKH
ncbi:MAG: galactose ABC transporter substrate-binding protein [Eubacteriales bacterium]|nr:galactose ABC transporter substrate-binding protein [Eubacteriales bacterium]